MPEACQRSRIRRLSILRSYETGSTGQPVFSWRRGAISWNVRPPCRVIAERRPPRTLPVTALWRVPEGGMDGERDEVIRPGQLRGRGARRELLQGLAGALAALAWGRSHTAARADL